MSALLRGIRFHPCGTASPIFIQNFTLCGGYNEWRRRKDERENERETENENEGIVLSDQQQNQRSISFSLCHAKRGYEPYPDESYIKTRICALEHAYNQMVAFGNMATNGSYGSYKLVCTFDVATFL